MLISEARGYLKRMIRWMSKDTSRCFNHDINVGGATLIMTHIDALASFYYGVNTDDHNRAYQKFGSVEKRFSGWVKKYLIQFNLESKDTKGNYKVQKILTKRDWGKIKTSHQSLEYANILYKSFRNGLVHEHLMNRGTAISRDVSKKIILDDSNNTLILNLGPLIDDFKRGIKLYATDLRSGKRTTQFNKRYRFLKRR